MGMPENESRLVEEVNSLISSVRAELNALDTPGGPAGTQDSYEKLKSAREKLDQVGLIAEHNRTNIPVAIANRRGSQLQSLLSRLSTQYNDNIAAPHSKEEEPPSVSKWETKFSSLNQEISSLAADIKGSITAKEPLIKYQVILTGIQLSLTLLHEHQAIIQDLNGGSLEDRKQKLQHVIETLEQLGKVLKSDPIAATQSEAHDYTTDTLADWEKDASKHPEFFRVTVVNTLGATNKALSTLEKAILVDPDTGNMDLKPGLDPFGHELMNVQNSLEAIKTNLVDLMKRASERIDKLRKNVDLDSNDKANLLETEYKDQITKTGEKVNRARLKVWEARIPATFPRHMELEPAFATLINPNISLSPKNRYVEWQRIITSLRTVIDKASQEVTSQITDSELAPQQKDFLFKRYTETAVANLAQQELDLLKFWKVNSLAIHPELSAWVVKVKALKTAPPPADAKIPIMELTALLKNVDDSIKNKSMPSDPGYMVIYEALRNETTPVLDKLKAQLAAADAMGLALQEKEKNKKDLNWFRDRLDTLEGNFKTFDDAAQAQVWNEVLKAEKEQKAILSATEMKQISDEILARKFLHLNWMMMDNTFNTNRMMEKLKPEDCEVSSEMLDYLCKMDRVGDAFRYYDRVWQGRIPELPNISTENFGENSDRVHGKVGEKFGPLAQKIAWRLQLSFMRPSEFDRTQGWAGGKDQFRETMHVLEFRWKYYEKDRTAGPPNNLSSYFERADKVDSAQPPVITLVAEHDLPTWDPGFDLYPGFFHFTYLGETVDDNGHLKKKPSEMYTPAGSSYAKITDFAHPTKYRNAEGDLMIENMEWQKLDAQNLKRWYSEMKTVAFEIRHKIEELSYSAQDMTREKYYADMMSKWQYEEAYIYGIRDLGGAAMRGDKDAKRLKDETMEQFRQQWLAGVVYVSFSAPPEGRDNWSMDDLRDVLRAAVLANFITVKSSMEIQSNANLWKRAGKRILREVIKRVGDPFKQA